MKAVLSGAIKTFFAEKSVFLFTEKVVNFSFPLKRDGIFLAQSSSILNFLFFVFQGEKTLLTRCDLQFIIPF